MPGGIKEVARQAGVAIATVSRVINDSKPVREEIRQRVLSAVEKVGYVPNHAAQSMASGKTMIIGIVVPSGAESFNSLALSGVREALAQGGYQSLICEIEHPMSIESEVRYLDILSRRIADGIILMHETHSQRVRETLKQVTIPIVVASVEIRGRARSAKNSPGPARKSPKKWRTARPPAKSSPRLGLQERLRPLEKFLEARLFRIARLAGMDDRDLAGFCRLDHLAVRSGRDVLDVGLLVVVVLEHPRVHERALVARRAPRRLDVGK